MSDVKNIVSSVNRVEPLSGVSGGKQGSLLLEVYKQKLLLFKAQRDLVEYLKVSDRLAKKCQEGNNEMDSLGTQKQYLKTEGELKKFDKKMEALKFYLRKRHTDFSTQAKKIQTTIDMIGKAEDYLKAHQNALEEALQQKSKPQNEIRKIIAGCKRIKTMDLPALRNRIVIEKKTYARHPEEPLDVGALEKAVEYGEALVEFGERVGPTRP